MIFKTRSRNAQILDESSKQTMGDVPICTMLSGGIDSVLTTFYVLKILTLKGLPAHFLCL